MPTNVEQKQSNIMVNFLEERGHLNNHAGPGESSLVSIVTVTSSVYHIDIGTHHPCLYRHKCLTSTVNTMTTGDNCMHL